MKVLTVKEPYASLIINGYKKYEFRTWKTNYRGKILIHAGKSFDKETMNRFSKLNLKYKPGYIIGEVNIIDCISITKEFNDKLIKENELIYGMNKNRTGYAWKLDCIKIYDNPIKINGKLGLWNYN